MVVATEIIKTEGIVLAIRPWSRTSHVVIWLTPDLGTVTTLVKGAVRPKSLFLGQYDLFYRCELLYYRNASASEVHQTREVRPLRLREHLRADWRAVALAGYAAELVRELAPPGGEAAKWFEMLDAFLESRDGGTLRRLVRLEMKVLELAGLAPEFSGMDPNAEWTPFAIDRGCCGEGTRTLRLVPTTVTALQRADSPSVPDAAVADAVRFLGRFIAFHLELPPDVRRSLTAMLA